MFGNIRQDNTGMYAFESTKTSDSSGIEMAASSACLRVTSGYRNGPVRFEYEKR
jgi:hypothetical protein